MLVLRRLADGDRPRSLLRTIWSWLPAVPWMVLYLSARGADDGVGILTVAVFAGVSMNEDQITRLFTFADTPRALDASNDQGAKGQDRKPGAAQHPRMP